MNKPKKALYLSFGALAAIGFVALFMWYTFTFNQFSKYPISEVAHMLAYDNTEIEGYCRGYQYPMPPYAKDLYFYNKTIDRDHIKWLESKGGLSYIFIRNAKPLPDNADKIANRYLKYGLNINAPMEPTGTTPLHLSAKMNHAGLTELLIIKGANPELRISKDSPFDPNARPIDLAKKSMDGWMGFFGQQWDLVKAVAEAEGVTKEEYEAFMEKRSFKKNAFDILKLQDDDK